MAVTAPQILTKQPGEQIKFAMDFSNILDTSETISSVDGVTAERVGGGSSDLTLGSASISGDEVQFNISGGTNARRYRIQVTVTTSSGNIRQGDGILKVKSH